MPPIGNQTIDSSLLPYLADLSGSVDGCRLIRRSAPLLHAVIQLTEEKVAAIRRDAFLVLVNVSATDEGAVAILEADKTQLVSRSVGEILNPTSTLADPCAMILSNISRPRANVEQVIDILESLEHSIDRLLAAFTRKQFNQKNMNLDYIGPIFSNLTQSARGRDIICDPEQNMLIRILPFTNHPDNLIRRGGATGILKNVCFDSARHDWLLSESVNVLPFILLPLAGPEEYSEEDNDKFPIELQYLDADKQREPDVDLRNMLLDCLSQLCATTRSRELLRSKGAYEILREYHKWETSRKALYYCENIVNILLRTEEEIGEDDLSNLAIPEHLHEKFEKVDEEECKEEDEVGAEVKIAQ